MVKLICWDLIAVALLLALGACASQPSSVGVAATSSDLLCTWSDQIRVELWGDVVGGPLELEPAKAACEAMGSRCAGITSEWYQGFPFMLVSGEKPVRPGGDYGIHYVMRCRGTSGP